jgi:acyl carrier protein
MQLSVSVAFHHPGMRVVREFSHNGLRGVPMQGTRVPMLSNVTTGLYPDDAEGIREYLLDLDENPVRWVGCVDVMWRQYKARHFLELGPGDTLCGLIGDIRPEALCLAAGRKGKEAENLRALVARLHALGHLPGACGPVRPGGFSMRAPQSAHAPIHPEEAPSGACAPLSAEPAPAHVEEILPILMEATGLARRELHPDMDLRHDLALRSSRFLLIMHEVDRRFGIALRFDDLLGVATVRDLADRIQDLRRTRTSPEQPGFFPRPAPAPAPLPESSAQEAEATCETSRHFSHFRELWLADARPWPDSPHSCLPPSMQLVALTEGAAQMFPRLMPAGAEELSFAVAECPPGLTREGHVHCRALRARDDRQRECRSELRLRDLTPNGRARHSCSLVCSARILLARDAPKMSAPLLPDPAPVPASASAAPAGGETLRNFYARHTGFGPRFRLLTDLYALEEKRLLARMRVPSEAGLAGRENLEYIYSAYVFEAAAQAALLLALQRVSGQDGAVRLALSRAAAVSFARHCLPGETFGLDLRGNADGPHGPFDAEMRDARGHIVLALRGIFLGTE